MAEIILYDYTEVDPFWGDEMLYCIGYGNLSSAKIVPQIQNQIGSLDVKINSVGGKVFDGWAIYNALVAYKKIAGNSVTVYVDGVAASIASIIAMAGDTVIMAQASMMMVHKPTSGICGWFDSDDLQAEANSLKEIEVVLVDVYKSKTGLSSAKLQSMIDAETWLSPDTALALSFCDQVDKAVKSVSTIIPENVFNKLFTNSSEQTKIYANSIFTIKNQNMSTVKDLMEKQDKTNTILDDILNFFKKDVKNEGEQEEIAPVAEPEKETEGEETVESLKAKVVALEKEKADNAEIVNKAQSMFDQANSKYDEVVNLLKEVKSNYNPAPEEKEFSNKGGQKEEKTGRFSTVKTK